jgi:hypothetical protein
MFGVGKVALARLSDKQQNRINTVQVLSSYKEIMEGFTATLGAQPSRDSVGRVPLMRRTR